jgi:hypothetical protein
MIHNKNYVFSLPSLSEEGNTQVKGILQKEAVSRLRLSNDLLGVASLDPKRK